MNKIFILYAIIAALLCYKSYGLNTCPAFVCSSADLNPGKQTGVLRPCANVTETNGNVFVNMGACDNSNYSCQSADGFNNHPVLGSVAQCSQITPQIPTGLLPGYHCSNTLQSLQCGFGGTCKNNVCVGNQTGQSCTINQNCDVNYYCYNPTLGDGTCLPAIQEKQACSDTALCGFGLICVNSTCLKVLSMPNGTVLQSSSSKSWLACESLTTLPLNNAEATVVCVSPPVLDSVNGYKQLQPLEGTQCTYRIPEQINYFSVTPSICQFSQTGMSICPLGVGDVQPEFQYMISNYYSRNLTSLCHISQPLQTMCSLAIDNIVPTNKLKAYLAVFGSCTIQNEGFVDATAYIADNSECTKQLITYSYWSLMSSASRLIISGTVLAFLLSYLV